MTAKDPCVPPDGARKGHAGGTADRARTPQRVSRTSEAKTASPCRSPSRRWLGNPQGRRLGVGTIDVGIGTRIATRLDRIASSAGSTVLRTEVLGDTRRREGRSGEAPRGQGLGAGVSRRHDAEGRLCLGAPAPGAVDARALRLGPNPKAAEFGAFGVCHVRFGKASNGSPPRRRGVLTVMDWSVEVISEWVEEVLACWRPDSSGLWPSERHDRVSEDRLNGALSAASDSGLPSGLSPHCLRHSYVSHLIEDGYDPLFVQSRSVTGTPRPPRSTPRSRRTIGRGCCERRWTR